MSRLNCFSTIGLGLQVLMPQDFFSEHAMLSSLSFRAVFAFFMAIVSGPLCVCVCECFRERAVVSF